MRNRQQNVYQNLNIMQRHEMVNGFAKDVINKLGKEAVTKEREKELIEEGVEKGINSALCAMLRVLYESYGKCNKKSTRLKNAFELFSHALANIDCPDEIQLAAEAEFFRQTGNTISRKK